MCAGSTKVKMPKMPEPQAAPTPPPPPPRQEPKSLPRMVKPEGAVPDIRIGSQKSSNNSRNRNNSTNKNTKGSLNISDNMGLNV